MGTHPIFESDFDCLTEMFTRSVTRSLSASAALNKKVAVLGAAGGIGQPLALLLKCNTSVTGVNVYDVAPVTPGVGADLSHIDTRAAVESFVGDDLEAAVAGCDVVLIPAGVPRKPGMTRDDLFNTNATIVANLTRACARAAPLSQLHAKSTRRKVSLLIRFTVSPPWISSVPTNSLPLWAVKIQSMSMFQSLVVMLVSQSSQFYLKLFQRESSIIFPKLKSTL